MTSEATPLRAPQGAIGWTASDGFLYERAELTRHVAAGRTVLVVSDDGYLRGVTGGDRAPLAAVLRVDADLIDVVQRLHELAVRAADLTDRVAGFDTGLAVEVSSLKGRVRKLEERSR